MIGLSVSLCCAEMAQGKVDPASVEKIVARTACETNEQWMDVIASYRIERWGLSFADKAARIANEFWRTGKIEQPRLTKNRIPDIDTTGIWVDSEDKIAFVPLIF